MKLKELLNEVEIPKGAKSAQSGKLNKAADAALKATDENGGKDEFFKAWGAASDALGDALVKKFGVRLNRPSSLEFVKALY